MLGLLSEELVFGGAYFRREFCVPKWVGLDNKNGLNTVRKPPKTANTNSPWEGYLRRRFGGRIFGRVVCFFFSFFLFLGGGELIIRILR